MDVRVHQVPQEWGELIASHRSYGSFESSVLVFKANDGTLRMVRVGQQHAFATTPECELIEVIERT